MRIIIAISITAALLLGCDGDDSDLPPFGGSLKEYYVGKGDNINNYRTVTIGKQVWMAENLDYSIGGSRCYAYKSSNCKRYGRLYDWATAMALPSECNSSACADQVQAKHQGICPTGWHIPNHEEWDILSDYVKNVRRCSSCDAKHLKAINGWNDGGNGWDKFGFAALPGGFGYSDGSFGNAGYYGYWWSATEYDATFAYYRNMSYRNEEAYWYDNSETTLFSVRCVHD